MAKAAGKVIMNCIGWREPNLLFVCDSLANIILSCLFSLSTSSFVIHESITVVSV